VLPQGTPDQVSKTVLLRPGSVKAILGLFNGGAVALASATCDLVKDAGGTSRTKCGTEDPARRAGPKVPVEERKASRGEPRGMANWRGL